MNYRNDEDFARSKFRVEYRQARMMYRSYGYIPPRSAGGLALSLRIWVESGVLRTRLLDREIPF